MNNNAFDQNEEHSSKVYYCPIVLPIAVYKLFCPLPSTNLNSYNFRDLPSILLLKILTDEVEAKKAKNERTDLKSKEAKEKEFKKVANKSKKL